MSTGPYLKSKIGAHLRYPVKFTELQTLLSPSVEELPLQVWFYDGYKAPRKNESRESYVIFEARYYSPDTQLSGTLWQLFVYPVPLALLQHVGSVVPAGLACVRDWLLASRSPIWLSSGHALFIDFAPGSQEITVREWSKWK